MTTLTKAFIRYLEGYRKTVVFALTTQCNCKCLMCDMHTKEPEYISLKDAKKILDFLKNNKFLIVYFTGGEPTLHPHIVEIVEYANKLDLISSMTSNGTSSKQLLTDLKKAGLYTISISLDHWNPFICEKIRGHKNIMAKQLETIRYLKEIGVRTYALVFLNTFLVEKGIDKLITYVNEELKVPFGFCYPTKAAINSYGLGGVFSEEELYDKMEECVNTILASKKKGQVIANLYTYIEDIVNFHNKDNPNFYCKGGEDVVYIDWLGDVYPCFIKKKLFNILKNDDPRFLKDVKCNDCVINCFREPSILPHAISSPLLMMKELWYSYNTKQLFS
ncbi:MAG: radical SAM protein [Candidatus Bathyarchaeota archaeon]|nr:MAG: radical SAM protein [Candidatus Bathyarchaeota archaeon]